MTKFLYRAVVGAARCWLIVAALGLAAAIAHAQGRLERDGVVLYWGLDPSGLLSQEHAQEDLHGGRPPGGGKLNHLVIALFDARSGTRIDKAVVRAQLSEPGIVDAPSGTWFPCQ